MEHRTRCEAGMTGLVAVMLLSGTLAVLAAWPWLQDSQTSASPQRDTANERVTLRASHPRSSRIGGPADQDSQIPGEHIGTQESESLCRDASAVWLPVTRPATQPALLPWPPRICAGRVAIQSVPYRAISAGQQLLAATWAGYCWPSPEGNA